MHSDTADLILRSDAIFTAARNELFSGYVVIKNGAIAAMIANGEDIQTWRGERTRFIELGDRLICPGFCDNHTFFTGYMSMQRGVSMPPAIVIMPLNYYRIQKNFSLRRKASMAGAGLLPVGERCLMPDYWMTLSRRDRLSPLTMTKAIAG